MKNVKIISIVAGALAAVGVGLAAPALAQGVIVDAAQASVIGVNAPNYEFQDLDGLHNRGPRAGIQGPGFVPVRPIAGPASDGR
jgi:hypothetical protein